MFNLKFKNAISPVVSISLLLVVAVVAVVGFQNWFTTFSSSVFVDVESEASNSFSDLKIEKLVGNTLYLGNINTENISVVDIEVNGVNCNITLSSQDRFIKVNLSMCLENITILNPDIIVVTNTNIYEKRVLIDSEHVDFSLSSNCPNGFVEVIGNGLYSTSNFCVMKYEAKNISNSAASVATGLPYVDITWQQAQTSCSNLGSNYHLITENEWLTIARDVENVSSNWNSSVVGSGFFYSGNTDNFSIVLAASSDDNDGYFGTGDSAISCDTSYERYNVSENTIYGRACLGQKRTLSLSNGGVIWDMSGNVWEWINETIVPGEKYDGGNTNWRSFGGTSDIGFSGINTNVPVLKSPISSNGTLKGLGSYYDGWTNGGGTNNINEAPDFCTGTCGTNIAVRRGGRAEGPRAGIYTLDYDRGVSYASSDIGFRCSYSLN